MKTQDPRDSHREPDEWLTVDEVCTELKISRRTFDRWRALGTGPKSQAPGRERIRSASAAAGSTQWLDATDQDIA